MSVDFAASQPSPSPASYMMGLRRARAQAQRDRDELAEQFEDAIGELRDEVRAVKSEFARVRMFDRALIAERDEHAWLN